MWHRRWDGTRWEEEKCVSGWLTSAPAVVSSGTDRIDCFYRGTDNTLWHRHNDGKSWSEEERVGGILS